MIQNDECYKPSFRLIIPFLVTLYSVRRNVAIKLRVNNIVMTFVQKQVNTDTCNQGENVEQNIVLSPESLKKLFPFFIPRE